MVFRWRIIGLNLTKIGPEPRLDCILSIIKRPGAARRRLSCIRSGIIYRMWIIIGKPESGTLCTVV
jgi:hypothetical protein